MHSIFLILWLRLSQAITTRPDLGNLGVIMIAIAYAFLSLFLGLTSGFLEWNPCDSKRVIIRVVITSLFAPAILEELAFRVLLLPYSSGQLSVSDLRWSIFALLLFVIYHPANALTFFPQGRETFFDPLFLGLAGMLGITCTVVYYQSGSLWLPVLFHWLAVVLWLLCFGGLKRLHFNRDK